MSKGLAFIVPLPPIEASLNYKPASRGGRLAQNLAVQRYKESIVPLIKAAMRKGEVPCEPLVAHYTWFLGKTVVSSDGKKRTLRDRLCRPKDDDNAKGAAKPIQDAMQLAGLLPNGDAAGRIKVGDVELLSTERKHGGQKNVLVVVMSASEVQV